MDRPVVDLAGFRRHGGRLAAAREAFPNVAGPWLDLSTGVNPRPWRGPRPSLHDLQRLPDPADVTRLEALAAQAFGLDPARVAAIPGAEAGLRLAPGLTGARTVAILSPTYGGHAEAWQAAGAEVGVCGPSGLTGLRSDALVVVNPNNPDGGRTDATALLAQADARWTIVDEFFVETTPELSLAAHAGGRLIVLRSFGKFYGLPGVRLGFLLAAPAIAARARATLGDWPLSAEALAAGLGAYADAGWRERTRQRLDRDAARLDRSLRSAGFGIVGGCGLFRLTERHDAAGAFRALAGCGILTRPFAQNPRWLRFGLPGPRDWSRLDAALEALRP